MQIEVRNDSPRDLTVTRAILDSSAFAGTSSWTRNILVPSGTTRDLPVLLGAPVCSAGVTASVILAFETVDGATGRARVTPDDPFDALHKVTSEDCLGERVAAIATLSLGKSVRVEQRDEHPVALLDLTMTPTSSAGRIAVSQVGTTILVRPDSGGPTWPLGWTSDAGPQTTTLEIIPNNCNTHVVAEDKRGTYFPVHVQIADGDSGVVFVPASVAVKGEIYAYIAGYCGW